MYRQQSFDGEASVFLNTGESSLQQCAWTTDGTILAYALGVGQQYSSDGTKLTTDADSDGLTVRVSG